MVKIAVAVKDAALEDAMLKCFHVDAACTQYVRPSFCLCDCLVSLLTRCCLYYLMMFNECIDAEMLPALTN